MAINNICSIIFMLVVVLMIRSSVQESCHNAMGKSLCDLKKCPKVQCKGNLGKDQCNCCDICLKQEGQSCGGDFNLLGKCDHAAPLCEFSSEKKGHICMSYKTAIKNGIAKYMKQAKQCQNKSKKYKELSAKLPFKCYMNLQGPSYYCLKNPTYTKDDCCIHPNGCNPNEELYERVVTVNTAYLADMYQERRSAKKHARIKKAYFSAKRFIAAAKAYLSAA